MENNEIISKEVKEKEKEKEKQKEKGKEKEKEKQNEKEKQKEKEKEKQKEKEKEKERTIFLIISYPMKNDEKGKKEASSFFEAIQKNFKKV